MADITIQGHAYQTAKLPLIEQFHISRKLTPYIIAAPKLDVKISALAAIARLNESDSEYVVNCALAVTQRKQEQNWAHVGTLRTPMFADMPVMSFYEIAAEVIQESLGSFFVDLLSKIAAANPSEA